MGSTRTSQRDHQKGPVFHFNRGFSSPFVPQLNFFFTETDLGWNEYLQVGAILGRVKKGEKMHLDKNRCKIALDKNTWKKTSKKE